MITGILADSSMPGIAGWSRPRPSQPARLSGGAALRTRALAIDNQGLWSHTISPSNSCMCFSGGKYMVLTVEIICYQMAVCYESAANSLLTGCHNHSGHHYVTKPNQINLSSPFQVCATVRKYTSLRNINPQNQQLGPTMDHFLQTNGCRHGLCFHGAQMPTIGFSNSR